MSIITCFQGEIRKISVFSEKYENMSTLKLKKKYLIWSYELNRIL